MATTAKLPSVSYTEIDNSGVLPEQMVGAHGVITPTLFGPSDKPVLITTIADFKATFGGADEVRAPFFPQLKRALQRGVSLYVQRLVAGDATAATMPVDQSAWLQTSNNLTIEAKYAGSWANGVLGIDFVNGTTNNSVWGLKVRYAANTDIEETFTADTLDNLFVKVNAWSKLINITVNGTVVAPATTTGTQFLTGGTDGSWSGGEGADPKTSAVNSLLHNFDDTLDIDTVSVLGLYTDEHLQNLIEYCEAREDVIGLFEVDPAFSVDEAQSFMDSLSEVSSTHVAIYYGTQLKAYSSELQKDVVGPILMDVVGAYSYNDTIGERYEAPAGAKRGLIPNVKTFTINLLSPARKTAADKLVATACNIVGSHPAFGPVVWGASTFNKGKSAKGPAGTVSALDAVHVRRMLIDLHRNLLPIYQSTLFDPQDPKTWRDAYGKAKPILTKLEKARAIYPGWQYIGDQGASKVTDARYNKPEDLAVGKYRVLIPLVPVGFISQINFTVQVNSLLSMFQTGISEAGGDMPTA